MELYSFNDGVFAPFDIEEYTETIKSQTYIKTRKEQRERAKARRKQKEQTLLRRFIGIGMLAASFGVCKMMVATGERDVTYMLVLVPVALAIIFAKD